MKKRYVVHCNKHGVESKDWDGKQVVVPAPKSKNDKQHSGCPFCKKDAASTKE